MCACGDGRPQLRGERVVQVDGTALPDGVLPRRFRKLGLLDPIIEIRQCILLDAGYVDDSSRAERRDEVVDRHGPVHGRFSDHG